MFTIVFVILIGAIKCSFISFITVALAFTSGNLKFASFSDTFDSFPLNFTVYTLNFSISLLYLLTYSSKIKNKLYLSTSNVYG